jgi:hypothetical protein
VKLKLALGVGICLLTAFIGALAYGVSSGCSYCGPALAGLLGVTVLVVLPVSWSLTRPFQENRICVNNQGVCEHKFVHDEYQKVLVWRGDTLIWRTVRDKRCWKCAYVESDTTNDLLDPSL